MPFDNYIISRSNNNSPIHHQKNNNIKNYSLINNQQDNRKSFKEKSKNFLINNISRIFVNDFKNPIKSYDKKKNLNINIPINYSQNNMVQKENQESFEKDLLKIFITIYYYEKNMSEKKENAFNSNEKYYLINPKWLLNFKKYCGCERLYHLLSSQNNNNSINYNNLDDNIDYIINNYNFNKDILNYEKKELSEELIDIKRINCSITRKYNIVFMVESIIFPSKIMELIKTCYKLDLKYLITKELIFKGNNIIYINTQSVIIIIGKLNDYNYFIPKYIFSYNTLDILKKEKNILLSDSFLINEYIKYCIPIENNKNFLNLNNEKNENLGKLIIMENKNNQNNNKQKQFNIRLTFSRNFKKHITNENNDKIRTRSHDKINEQIDANLNRFSTPYSQKTFNYFNYTTNKKKNISRQESNNSKNITQINEEFYLNQINQLKKNILKLNEEKKFIEDLLEQKNIELNNMKKNIEQFKNENNELKRIKNNLEIKLDKTNNEINYYNKLEEKNKERINDSNNKQLELLKKEEEIEKKSIMLNNKELNIIIREEEIINKNEIINKKQFEIIKKEKEIEKKNNLLNENISKLSKKKEKIENIYKKLQNEEIEISKKERKLKEKDIEILKIKKKILDKNESLKKKELQIIQKERELNNKYSEILIKEKNFNNEMKMLEDKKNLLEKEIEELVKKKKQFQNNYGDNITDKIISKLLVLLKEKDYLKINKEEEEKILKEILLNEPLLFYSSPTLIGLNNIGNISFLNSILQCLSQTKSLTNYFLNAKNRDIIINNSISLQNKNDFQLSPLYLELINNLWFKNESKSFSPYNFVNKIEEINPLL